MMEFGTSLLHPLNVDDEYVGVSSRRDTHPPSSPRKSTSTSKSKSKSNTKNKEGSFATLQEGIGAPKPSGTKANNDKSHNALEFIDVESDDAVFSQVDHARSQTGSSSATSASSSDGESVRRLRRTRGSAAQTSTASSEPTTGVADGLLRSRVHPRFLHSNSTSHKWPFGAIAELVDNACDPDVRASLLNINYDYIHETAMPILTVTDDGQGATYSTLYKMLSLGYCDKGQYLEEGAKPIGAYGNGFKSGSMRLGNDVLVLSKQAHTRTIGMLSQTYLENIGATEVIVPIAEWDSRFRTLLFGKQADVDVVLEHSPFTTLKQIQEQFNLIRRSGTRIVIYNLREQTTPEGDTQLELDFESDLHDIRLRGVEPGQNFVCTRINQPQNTDNPLDYSLRAYLEVIYLRPRMRIVLRGERVRTRLLRQSLKHGFDDLYRPSKGNEVIVTFGVSPVPQFYGMMLYHHNRLIKVCERVGIQLQSNCDGEGVLGIMEADFLQPTHNKQDFNETPQYRRLLAALAKKLKEYWDLRGDELDGEDLQDTWVQCELCLKWRNLGVVDSVTQLNALEDGEWMCSDIGMGCDMEEKTGASRIETIKKVKEHRKIRNAIKREQQQAGMKRSLEMPVLNVKRPKLEDVKMEKTSTYVRLTDDERLQRVQRIIGAMLPPHVSMNNALTWEFLDTVDIDQWVARIETDKAEWETMIRSSVAAGGLQCMPGSAASEDKGQGGIGNVRGKIEPTDRTEEATSADRSGMELSGGGGDAPSIDTRAGSGPAEAGVKRQERYQGLATTGKQADCQRTPLEVHSPGAAPSEHRVAIDDVVEMDVEGAPPRETMDVEGGGPEAACTERSMPTALQVQEELCE